MTENNKNRIHFAVFALLALGVGIGFYRYYANLNQFDIYQHGRFADALLSLSLEEMKAADLPVWALTYPLFHLTVKLAALVLHKEIWMPMFLIMGMSVTVSILVYRFLVLDILQNKSLKSKIFADVISMVAVIFNTAAGPLTEGRFYSMQGGANPVHNPTVLFVRPLGLLSVLFFMRYVRRYFDKEKYIWPLIGFGVFSLLGAAAKPSFAFVFLPAMAVITLMEMIRRKSLRFGIFTLLSVLPAGGLLLFQFLYTRQISDALDLEIRFGSYVGFTPLQVLMVSVATFPVLLILISPKLFRVNDGYRLGMLALVIGWLQMFFLSNGPAGDFSWGYDLAVQIGTVFALTAAFKSNLNPDAADEKIHPIQKYSACVAFLYQIVCGIIYMVLVLRLQNAAI